MKRITSTVALLAFVTALTASVALAQQGTATKPAEPAKTEAKAEAKTETTMPAKHHHMAKMASAKLDLNTCSQEDLTKLGLTDEDAAKVISNRPYASKAQLKTKGGLTAKEYAKLSKHVWAKQAKAEKAEKTETAK